MDHKKQKKRADSGFDKGYSKGYKNAHEEAYNKGYREGHNRGFLKNDVPAIGAITALGAITHHYDLAGKVDGFVGSAWKFVKENLPKNVQETICGTDPNTMCINNLKNIVVDNPLKSALTVAGISLAYYLYTQARGTPEEKAAVNRKLRMARRMTEETSDKRIKRRQTNKIRHLTKSFGSEGVSESVSEGSSEGMSEGMSNSMTESSSSRSRRSRRTRRLR